MTVQENVSLKQYSTMRLGGNARYLCAITSDTELLEALKFASEKKLNTKTIGSGSNLVWSDSGYDGLVIVNNIGGIEITNDVVKIGAGVEWDKAVETTVNSGLSGIEFLSWIPGSSGATPVQNVGAYGKELSDVLINLRAYDLKTNRFVILKNSECGFGYRKSRFNHEDSDRFIITDITLQLSKERPTPPFYKSLQEYLDKTNVVDYTPVALRNAVIEVRKAKLPDPDHVANNGSFFANPILENTEFDKLQQQFPDIPHWTQGAAKKISAAWLIDRAGFKDFHDEETGMATWSKQPLVLINENAKSTEDLEKFKQKIVTAVREKFNVALAQEPESVG